MKLIELTRGLFAKVDNKDFSYLNKFNWHASFRKKINGESVCYAARKFRKQDGTWTNIYMHREIMNVLFKPNVEIDHNDGDRLNNQKYNLRLCKDAQNKRNRDKQINNTSGYKGVFKHILKTSKNIRWLAQLRVNKEQIYLGRYKTEKEAAVAYNAGAIKYHGEFAKLNVIEP